MADYVKVIKRAPQTTALGLSPGHVGRARRGNRAESFERGSRPFGFTGPLPPLGDGRGIGSEATPAREHTRRQEPQPSPTRATAQTRCSPRAVTVCAATRSKPSPTAGAARPPTYQGAAANPARHTPPHEVTARRGNTELRATKRRQGAAPAISPNRPFCGGRSRAPARGRQAANRGRSPYFAKCLFGENGEGAGASAGGARKEPLFYPRAALRRRTRGRAAACARRAGAAARPAGSIASERSERASRGFRCTLV